MRVRHNTQLLEQAVAHVVRQAEIPSVRAEAEAFQSRERATGWKRIATGGAIGVAAVGLGWGLALAYPDWREDIGWRTPDSATGSKSGTAEAIVAPTPTESPPETGANSVPTVPQPTSTPDAGKLPDGPIGVPTTDYTQFRTQQVHLFGQTWEVQAGHHFETNEPGASWDSGWCYSTHQVGGVQVQIDLAYRDGEGAFPRGPGATRETLAEAGITSQQALTLATNCPWLDGRTFTASEFEMGKQPGLASEAAVDAPPPGMVAFVQFGSFPELSSANAELVALRARWRAFLGTSEISTQTVPFGQNEVRYNLRASFASLSEANGACAAIEGAGGECFAARY